MLVLQLLILHLLTLLCTCVASFCSYPLQVMARLPSRLLGAATAASFAAPSSASKFAAPSALSTGLLQRRFMSADGAGAPKTAGVWAPPPRPTPGQDGYAAMTKVRITVGRVIIR